MSPMLEPDSNIHQPTRLRIMILLSGVKEAGYIAISKSFQGKMPRTRYRLTSLGRQRLAEYWQRMDEIRAGGQTGK